MRIGIQTWGSEGDLRPFFALADGLAAAGHEVRVSYCSAERRDYSTRLKAVRFEHRPTAGAHSSEELVRICGEIFFDPNPVRQLDRIVRDLLDPVVDGLAEAAKELAAWAEVLVLHPFAHPLAAAAEQERKPLVAVYPTPFLPTRDLAVPGLPNLGPLNLLAWKAVRALFSRKLLPSVMRVRSRWGLPPIGRIEGQLDRSVFDLVALSPTLLPRPSDWAAKVHVSGFLSPPPPVQPEALDPRLEAFLTAGPPPVYVTFGSMSAVEKNPQEVLSVAEQALERVGARGIIQCDTPAESSAAFFRIGPARHDVLFPRCAAVVHHGGAGTTQAALRAGRPSVVVAHVTDQFLWGRQLERMGVAPRCLARRGITADELALRVGSAVGQPSLRARAEELGQRMSAEDGVGNAVQLIERAGRPT